jgi:hypothetical protein
MQEGRFANSARYFSGSHCSSFQTPSPFGVEYSQGVGRVTYPSLFLHSVDEIRL